MEAFKALYEILRDRPDLFITALLLLGFLTERSERKEQQKLNLTLTDKMHAQNSDTKDTLTQIKMLLEILTRGRH